MSTVGVDKIMPSTKRASLREASTKALQASMCQLYTCRRPFEPKGAKGKKQVFCSVACRVRFFREARVIGAALLRRSLTDPNAGLGQRSKKRSR